LRYISKDETAVIASDMLKINATKSYRRFCWTLQLMYKHCSLWMTLQAQLLLW